MLDDAVPVETKKLSSTSVSLLESGDSDTLFQNSLSLREERFKTRGRTVLFLLIILSILLFFYLFGVLLIFLEAFKVTDFLS